ncbi:SprT family protein [Leuconostoc sp. C2]|uniref:SprT family protein n=1 Tax=Leuconostoc sp. (strain C2) TaxID=979982 RepID=UPI00021756AE|nr:SprT family protein [Leuconostoc sp. C2]AEJ30106.1 hypothetical protein LGMK_00210 [Leuconostoc sp. C2]
MITQQQLQLYVVQISKQYFNRPFNHSARFNKRLKTTGGRYLLRTHDLEFNPQMANLPEFEGIVKHELVHYHLHLQQKGFQHNDAAFKQLLIAVGGSRYAPRLSQAPRHLWRYRCENDHQIMRQRRFSANRYRCGQCGAQIFFVGEVDNR